MSDASRGAEALRLNNIVQYASNDILHVLMAKHDNNRMEYLSNTEELVHFDQAIESDVRGENATGRDVVLSIAVKKARADTRTCYNCNNVKHIAADCRGNKQKIRGEGHARDVKMTHAFVYDRIVLYCH